MAIPKNPRSKEWRAERDKLLTRGERRCARCRTIKKLNPEFYKVAGGPNGYQNICKSCDNEQQKNWWATSKSPSAVKARKSKKRSKDAKKSKNK